MLYVLPGFGSVPSLDELAALHRSEARKRVSTLVGLAFPLIFSGGAGGWSREIGLLTERPCNGPEASGTLQAEKGYAPAECRVWRWQRAKGGLRTVASLCPKQATVLQPSHWWNRESGFTHADQRTTKPSCVRPGLSIGATLSPSAPESWTAGPESSREKRAHSWCVYP